MPNKRAEGKTLVAAWISKKANARLESAAQILKIKKNEALKRTIEAGILYYQKYGHLPPEDEDDR